MKNKEILTINNASRTRTFETVKKIPNGFHVWNIGQQMGTDYYIPLCESLRPGNKNCFSVNRKTLKAIYLPYHEVMLLRDAAQYGITNLQKCHKAIANKPHNWFEAEQMAHALKTIDIFEKIS